MIEAEKCTGCGACKNICPFSAIEMKAGINGFLYPIIDQHKCKQCGLCDKVCMMSNSKQTNNVKRIVGIKHKNNIIRESSTSGGAFYLLAKKILDEGGVVYGAAFDSKWKVHHLRVNNLTELKRLQKSKYVQSDLKDTYIQVECDLLKGVHVLFSGTACQCSGLLAFLDAKNIKRELLITCDLICHGVPSPAIWADYVKDKMKNGNIIDIDFREKRKSWRDFRMSITYDIRTKTYRQNEDFFMVLFFHNYILRESCYECKYASVNRVADFTLGDFWGIEDCNKHFSDDKGISVVMINSDTGSEFIDTLLEETYYFETTEEDVTRAQPNLKRPTHRNKDYEYFWKDYSEKGYSYIIKKYADATPFGIFKRRYLFKLLHYTGIFDLLLKIKNRRR